MATSTPEEASEYEARISKEERLRICPSTGEVETPGGVLSTWRLVSTGFPLPTSRVCCAVIANRSEVMVTVSIPSAMSAAVSSRPSKETEMSICTGAPAPAPAGGGGTISVLFSVRRSVPDASLIA
ncbi:MAG: hypothetical protein HYY93_02645 [Planctomycetes bacterium]|nr:hypothetical protein [Planctomycetota bacterium]